MNRFFRFYLILKSLTTPIYSLQLNENISLIR